MKRRALRLFTPRVALLVALSVVCVAAVGGVVFALLRGDSRDDKPPIVQVGRDEAVDSPGGPPDPLRRALIVVPAPDAAYHAALALLDVADDAVRYAAARDARDAGHFDLALALFDSVADAGGTLAPMAWLRTGQLLASLGDHEGAAVAFDDALGEDALPPALRQVALTEAAGNLARLGRAGEAIPLLDAVTVLPGTTAFERARATWDAAVIRRSLGDPGWVGGAVATMRIAPRSAAALDALATLQASGIPAPTLDAALVHYRWANNAQAAQLYEAAIELEDLTDVQAAQAWFYLGALAERAFEPFEALDAYERSLDAAPGGPLADDAHYWRGRLFEALGEPGRAALEYDRLVERFPASPFAEDGALRGALALGFAGDTDAAMARLETVAATADPVAAAEAARWHTVFRTAFDAPAADALDARDYHPWSLHALLEDDPSSPLPDGAVEERPAARAADDEDTVAEIEEWLAARYGPRAPAEVTLVDDPTTGLALTLHGAGEPSVARALLHGLAADHAREPYALFDLTLLARDAGLHDVTMRTAERLLWPLSPWERIEAPRPLLHLAYPAPFLDDLTAAAEEFAVPPLLLLALVRQESTFDAEAISIAGATGLAQVMPPTGQEIAGALGEPWEDVDLADPVTSLRYGAYYLGRQLEAYEGDVLAALAAYNGGPGNATRWFINQPFPGPDGYLYAIDFAETRLYLEHVVENYAWYRYLYTDAPVPAVR